LLSEDEVDFYVRAMDITLSFRPNPNIFVDGSDLLNSPVHIHAPFDAIERNKCVLPSTLTSIRIHIMYGWHWCGLKDTGIKKERIVLEWLYTAQTFAIREGRPSAMSTMFVLESHVNPVASADHVNKSSDTISLFVVLLFAIHVIAHAPW
jgi:hypothetical protein